jgi:hypothetical protein
MPASVTVTDPSGSSDTLTVIDAPLGSSSTAMCCRVFDMTKQIAGAPGRNGLAESARKQQEWDQRLPQWWDADGWAAYRTRMGIPQPEPCDD